MFNAARNEFISTAHLTQRCPKTGAARHARRMMFWKKGMKRSVLGQTATC
jgi:hypothetical protein